jgi:exodeoxyribonuclease VII small subunit
MTKKNFEDSLEKLEQIARELEDGELTLESSLKKFEEGIKLADFCSTKLDDAQAKVNLLLHKNGKLTSQPFETTNNDDIKGLRDLRD